MKVKVGISNRHIHLTKEDFNLLFGNIELEKRNDLTQPGEFASTLMVTIEGPKRRIENVRILGPFRSYTQVEISKTDSYNLGINPPVRDSGDLEDASIINIINNDKKIERKACIIPTRHIHINSKTKELLNLNSSVRIKINNEKGGILDNVHLKVSDLYNFELHLDTDDGNANLLNQGDEVEIIK
jgi:propanediol utilization protein